jgi:hypothetical protein
MRVFREFENCKMQPHLWQLARIESPKRLSSALLKERADKRNPADPALPTTDAALPDGLPSGSVPRYVDRGHAVGKQVNEDWAARLRIFSLDLVECLGNWWEKGESYAECHEQLAVLNPNGQWIATGVTKEEQKHFLSAQSAPGIGAQAIKVLDCAGIAHEKFSGTGKRALANLAWQNIFLARQLVSAVGAAESLASLECIFHVACLSPILATKLFAWYQGSASQESGPSVPSTAALNWICDIAREDVLLHDPTPFPDEQKRWPVPWPTCKGFDQMDFKPLLCFDFEKERAILWANCASVAEEIGATFPQFTIDRDKKLIYCGYAAVQLRAMGGGKLNLFLCGGDTSAIEMRFGSMTRLRQAQDERLALVLACFQDLTNAFREPVPVLMENPLAVDQAAQFVKVRGCKGIVFSDSHDDSVFKDCAIKFIEAYPATASLDGPRPTLYVEHIDRELLDAACDEYNQRGTEASMPHMLDTILSASDNLWRHHPLSGNSSASKASMIKQLVEAAHRKGWRIKGLQSFQLAQVARRTTPVLNDLRNALVNHLGWMTVKEDAPNGGFQLIFVGQAHANTMPGMTHGTPGLSQLLGFPVLEATAAGLVQFIPESKEYRRPLPN